MAKPYEHCGVTKGYTRPTECAPGYECKVQNEWYSQVRRPLRLFAIQGGLRQRCFCHDTPLRSAANLHATCRSHAMRAPACHLSIADERARNAFADLDVALCSACRRQAKRPHLAPSRHHRRRRRRQRPGRRRLLAWQRPTRTAVSRRGTQRPSSASQATSARFRTSGTARCAVRSELCLATCQDTEHPCTSSAVLRTLPLHGRTNATRVLGRREPLFASIAQKMRCSACADLMARCAVPTDVRPSAYPRFSAGIAVASARACGCYRRCQGIQELRCHKGLHGAHGL